MWVSNHFHCASKLFSGAEGSGHAAQLNCNHCSGTLVWRRGGGCGGGRRGPAGKKAAPVSGRLSSGIHHVSVRGVNTPPREKTKEAPRQAVYQDQAASPPSTNHTINKAHRPKKVRKPHKVPFNHARTTRWCLYQNEVKGTTSHCHSTLRLPLWLLVHAARKRDALEIRRSDFPTNVCTRGLRSTYAHARRVSACLAALSTPTCKPCDLVFSAT